MILAFLAPVQISINTLILKDTVIFEDHNFIMYTISEIQKHKHDAII